MKEGTRNILLLSAGLLFLAAACRGSTETEPREKDGLALPADFEITAYQGEALLAKSELNASDLLSSGRPLVLNMFAGLCPPCRIEMPDLQSVFEEYEDRIMLFGLDVGPFTALGSVEDGQNLLKEIGVEFPAGTTGEAEVMVSYRVLGMPSTFFIKPDGQVMKRWTGLLTREKMKELVEELIDASEVKNS